MTTDERLIIDQLERTNVDEFADLMASPSFEEERVLRLHLGDDQFQRMQSLAVGQRNVRSSHEVETPRGNVVVIPGIMGSELTATDQSGSRDRLWLDPLDLLRGRLERLRLAEDGRQEFDSEYEVRPSGIMKRFYGELLLSLSARWTVRAFWYDWRKDLNLAAAALAAQMTAWFGEDEPVHLIGHSMGGLVARTFVANHRDRWGRRWEKQPDNARGGRLILLGTPNHGSFSAPQVITGLDSIVRNLARADLTHDKEEIQQIVNSFVGLYQMLPSPLLIPESEKLYDAHTWGGLAIFQPHLDRAREHHKRLQSAVDPTRMIVVAGTNRLTVSGIADYNSLDKENGYSYDRNGDGRVPYKLGALASNGTKVRSYYVDESHAQLPSNDLVLASLDDLLLKGSTEILDNEQPAGTRGSTTVARKTMAEYRDDEEQAVGQLTDRIASRYAVDTRGHRNRRRNRRDPGTGASLFEGFDLKPDGYVGTDERELVTRLAGDFLSVKARKAREIDPGPASEVPMIEVDLWLRSIHDLDDAPADQLPVDSIAVGHYIGVRPHAAELALDQSISKALHRKRAGIQDLILTEFTDRGTLSGELGQFFFVHDLREPAGAVPGGRIIAIAGMGRQGQFGTPELSVLAGELCWALGTLHKHHLATIVIGSGSGNIPLADAVRAWMRGIATALNNASRVGHHLRRITFVTLPDDDGSKSMAICEGLRDAKKELEGRLEIHYVRNEELNCRSDAASKKVSRYAGDKPNSRRTLRARPGSSSDPAPTRLTLRFERDTYLVSALTNSASVPERDVRIDADLVKQANDELVGEEDPDLQVKRGRLLGGMLIPSELRSHLSTSAPLIMALDSMTARVHWEMVAQPNPGLLSQGSNNDGNSGEDEFDPTRFLGTSRGFTRQLITPFAMMPEPRPENNRVIRVLVVADPSEDAPLPRSLSEGAAVADLFESANRAMPEKGRPQIEVVRLFGPHEATRTRVLREIMLGEYDLLHFAGHCIYVDGDPAASGWIFTGGKLLSAYELDCVDRVPKFIFSNACESGVTPDRAGLRSAKLAPSFAEIFFKRGVANFVCTAWPVDDAGALRFARTFYERLLGLGKPANGQSPVTQPIHAAMREARIETAKFGSGRSSWGAYQHYGNPFYQLIAPPETSGDS